MRRRLFQCLVWVAAILTVSGGTATADGVAKPAVVIERPGRCIAPKAEMRRDHMLMLKHQRDRTVREGIRGAKVSLNGCIDCHASRVNGSVLGGKENFCQGCHDYTAARLDCFECHQAKKGFGSVASARSAR